MELNKYIDHTLLKADATAKDIEKLCLEAKEYDFASVCINPSRVRQAAELLKESDVKVCTVIGFPLGATSTESKVFETKQAILDGASEIDMVINIGYIKDKNFDAVRDDIKAVNDVKGDAILKVIIETCLLNDEEKVMACNLAVDAGADFVKTSTGFSTGGAKINDVVLMKKTIGDKAKVKASGGIKTHGEAVSMIAAGADRIGASSGIMIVTGDNLR